MENGVKKLTMFILAILSLNLFATDSNTDFCKKRYHYELKDLILKKRLDYFSKTVERYLVTKFKNIGFDTNNFQMSLTSSEKIAGGQSGIYNYFTKTDNKTYEFSAVFTYHWSGGLYELTGISGEDNAEYDEFGDQVKAATKIECTAWISNDSELQLMNRKTGKLVDILTVDSMVFAKVVHSLNE